MKRSEMIDKIVVHMSRKDWQEPDMEYNEYADKLLKMMEKAGITPPKWIPEDDGYLYGDSPSGEPNGFNITICKWEPEE